jgi:predicted ArsR family transcriptional regulator
LGNVNQYADIVVTSDPPRRTATDAEARALGSALRLRILRLCLGEALTNKEIAQRLGRDPASVLHHVRRLVDTGFLESAAERRGTRGAREIPYRATGKSWRLDIGTEQEANSDAMLEAFLQELEAAGGKLEETVRLGLRLRPEDRRDLVDRLVGILREFEAERQVPDGEWWSLFLAMHPDTRGRRGDR